MLQVHLGSRPRGFRDRASVPGQLEVTKWPRDRLACDARGPHSITMGSSEGAPKCMAAAPHLESEDRGPERPGSGLESPSKTGAELNGNRA